MRRACEQGLTSGDLCEQERPGERVPVEVQTGTTVLEFRWLCNGQVKPES